MENFRIDSLEINKIGPFQHLNIAFPQNKMSFKNFGKAEIHILTGGNGTGKSTILEALIYVVNYKIDSGILKSSLSKKLWGYPKQNNNKNSLDVRWEKGLFTCKNTNRGWNIDISNAHIIEQYLDFYQNNINGFEIAFFAYSGYRHVEDTNILGIHDIQEHPLQNTHNFNLSINPKNLIQWLANTQTRELISKEKGDTGKARQYRSTLKIIENALGEIIESNVKFDLEADPLGVKVIVDGQSLNFDQLPDGLKSMVSWIGDLLMRMDRLKWVNNTPVLERNFILLLDEIEVHLHPAWQRKILPVVQKLFKNAQIFISTHSPFVVGSVDGAWVHRFVKKDGYSVLAGEPILSEDAKSYDYILEEIFGIKERFGVEVERKLAEFQQLKKRILEGVEAVDTTYFRKLAEELAVQSVELESIIGMELRQLKRLTNQDFSLTEA